MAPEDNLRERTRQQMLDSLGGWSGTVVAGAPPLVFVVVDSAAGLHAAVIAAVATGVAFAGYRLARRQPVQQAVTGLFSVLIAALIAVRSGHARDYFALGIVSAFAYGTVLAVSLAVRRPLIGVGWEFLDPTPLPPGRRWFQVRPLRRGYDLATAAAVAVFFARGIVQLSLFDRNSTGGLAVARLAMGYPLYAAVVGYAFWIVRRARARLPAEPAGDDHAAADLAAADLAAADLAADDDAAADDAAADGAADDAADDPTGEPAAESASTDRRAH